MGDSNFSVNELSIKKSTYVVRGNKDKVVKDLFIVFSSNVLSLASGIVTGLLIPKFLGVIEYGGLMLFTFYVPYSSVLQFGYNDGIYIRYGKYDYNDLPKKKFVMYFRFLLISQLIVSLVVFVLLKMLVKDSGRMVIFSFICMNIAITNLGSFFNLVNEVTRRFRMYSLSLVMTKLLYVVFSYFFIIIGIKNHIFFIALITAVNLSVLAINLLASKEIVLGKGERIKDNMGDIKKNLLIGMPQLIGNFTVMLIIGTSRLFVDKFFTLNDFAMYSFAVSLISIIYLFIGAISTVTYPYLARAKKEKLAELYKKMKFLLLLFISISLTSFFLLKVFVITLLPAYTNAVDISLFLFATILFRSQIDVVSRNFFKVMMLQKDYTINVIIVFIVGVVIALLSYIVLRTTIGMAISTVLSFFIWMISADLYFVKKLKMNLTKLHVTEVLITVIFLSTALQFRWHTGIFLYLTSVIVILLLLYRNDFKQLIKHRLNYLSL